MEIKYSRDKKAAFLLEYTIVGQFFFVTHLLPFAPENSCFCAYVPLRIPCKLKGNGNWFHRTQCALPNDSVLHVLLRH